MLQKILYDFQIPKKYILITLGIATLGMSSFLSYKLVDENYIPKTLRIAAGKKDGESYIISKAIAKVVGEKTNIKIKVCRTDGTDDNLRAIKEEDLEGNKNNRNLKSNQIECESEKSEKSKTYEKVNFTEDKIHLATAQADRVESSTPVRSVAILYQDHFQLLVDPKKFGSNPETFEANKFKLSSLNRKIIGTPDGGGQRGSLDVIANNLDFPDFKHLDTSNRTQEPDAVFFVRSLNNERIREIIREKNWRLVPMKNLSALLSRGYYYYRKSTISKSTYKSEEPAVPKEELQTISIDRLLVAQKDIEPWIIKRITEVLDKHNQDIENQIYKSSNNNEQIKKTKNQAVASLIRNIKKPDENSDVRTHPGVDVYYQAQEEPYIVKNSDFCALILTIAGFAYAGYLNIKNLQSNQRIRQLVELIQQPFDKVSKIEQDSNIQLKKLFEQHKEVDLIFQKASVSLDSDGFRAFSEVYKSVREIIERAIEDKQRQLSSYYVQELVNLLNIQEDPDVVSEKLEKTFIEIANKLFQDDIFSRESFRTFTEAYDIVRETIERRKKEYL